MPKNVVVCLDGTGNELKAKGNTNVVHLYDLLDLGDPARQVAYYDPGVGTFSAPGAWTRTAQVISRVEGLAFGVGMKQNLGEAYTYLIQNYEPGDRLYVFGFSRGAYTARALAGLVSVAGIFRPGTENLVQYLVRSYTRGKIDWDQLKQFRNAFGQRLDGHAVCAVDFLGVWDTVKAAGILRWDAKWPYTHRLLNVHQVRHAVSIDEYRRPYREYLAEAHKNARPRPHIEEAWFAGVHSDVGGTFEDDPRLCKIALKWMMQGAVAHGLVVKQGPYHAMRAGVTADNALGTVHKMGTVWALVGRRKRPIPDGARLHASVQARMAALPSYRPTVPNGVTYVDSSWVNP